MNAISEALPVPLTQPDTTNSLLSIIGSVAADPHGDVTKLKVLQDMWERVVADDRKVRFHRAMRLAQADMEPVLRDSSNTTTDSRYASFEALDRAIRPIYTKHGFSVTCDSEPIAGGVRIWCEVAHETGHTKIITAELPLDTVGPRGQPNKSPVHGWKSAVSYLRRTTLEMGFNLATTGGDDDGNAAGAKGQTGEIIRREQAAELRRLVAECSRDPKATETNEPAFLKRMNLGDLRSIEDVRPKDFARLRTALLTKRSRILQAAQPGDVA